MKVVDNENLKVGNYYLFMGSSDTDFIQFIRFTPSRVLIFHNQKTDRDVMYMKHDVFYELEDEEVSRQRLLCLL